MNIPLKTLLIFGLLIALVSTEQFLSDGDSGEGSGDSTLTTKSPDANTSTTVASTSTTAASTSTTAASTSTTAASTSTTVASTSTTVASTSTTVASTSTTVASTSTTVASTSTTVTTAAATTAAATTAATQGPCALNPCVGDSTCEERFGSTFVCICRPGLVYLERGCTQTKVFPGRLTLTRTFIPEMADRKSEQFQKTASEIENALRNVLFDDDYINSTVIKLSEGSVVAEVQNFYDLSSPATFQEVEVKIATIKNEIPDFKEFNRGSACDLSICDNDTTICKEEEVGIVMCTCKEGYIRSPFTSHSCLSCPNGQKAVEEICEKCPFGFAGFNCDDPYLLVVVVVSSVSGALLIIFIVALIVVSCRNPKESSSSQVDFSSSYGNMELHKPTGVPRIPRANPESSWKSNNLEMTNSGSNQALVTRDRPESKTRYSDYEEDVSHRGHFPPAYSGYGGRGVENGGVQNPYFRQDDDRMRRY